MEDQAPSLPIADGRFRPTSGAPPASRFAPPRGQQGGTTPDIGVPPDRPAEPSRSSQRQLESPITPYRNGPRERVAAAYAGRPGVPPSLPRDAREQRAGTAVPIDGYRDGMWRPVRRAAAAGPLPSGHRARPAPTRPQHKPTIARRSIESAGFAQRRFRPVRPHLESATVQRATIQPAGMAMPAGRMASYPARVVAVDPTWRPSARPRGVDPRFRPYPSRSTSLAAQEPAPPGWLTTDERASWRNCSSCSRG